MRHFYQWAIISLAALLLGTLSGVSLADSELENKIRKNRVTETSLSEGGWLFEIRIHNQGSRSEYATGHLSYKGVEISPRFGQVITPIGRFNWTTGSWPPNDPGSWTQWDPAYGQDEIKAPKSSEAARTDADVPAENLNRGWYKAPFDRCARNTPEIWFYALAPGCWIDPAKVLQVLNELESLGESLAAPPALPEGPKPMPRPMPLINKEELVPEQPPLAEQALEEMRRLLPVCAQAGPEWAARVSADERTDPWNREYRAMQLTEMDASIQGYDWEILSAGPDGRFGTADDLSVHEDVPAGHQPPAQYRDLVEEEAVPSDSGQK